MIIDKITAFITEEDLQYLKERQKEQQEAVNLIATLTERIEAGYTDEEIIDQQKAYLTKLETADRKRRGRIADIESRYIASLNNDIEAVLSDAEEIVDAYTEEDYKKTYLDYQEKAIFLTKNIKGEKPQEAIHAITQATCPWSLAGVQLDLRRVLRVQFNALHKIFKDTQDQQPQETETAEKNKPTVPGVQELRTILESKSAKIWELLKDTKPPELKKAQPKQTIRTAKPQAYISPIDLMTGQTFSHTDDRSKYKEQDNGQLVLREALEVVKVNKKRNPVTTVWSIAYDGAEFSKPLSQYDRTVFNAIVSHIKAGNRFITLKMIYETLTGKTATRDSNLDDLRQSLDKMRTTMVKLDYTEEVGKTIEKAFTKPDSEGRYYLRDTVLHLAEAIENINGAEASCYFIDLTPPLLRYAEAKKQLASEPIAILNIPVNSSKNNLAIREYLYNRIKAMEHNKKLSKDIKLDSVCKAIQVGTKAQLNPTRIKDTCKRILDYWKTIGFIQDYNLNKRAKSPRFTIICKE